MSAAEENFFEGVDGVLTFTSVVVGARKQLTDGGMGDHEADALLVALFGAASQESVEKRRAEVARIQLETEKVRHTMAQMLHRRGGV